jgi:hypothetical protein
MAGTYCGRQQNEYVRGPRMEKAEDQNFKNAGA